MKSITISSETESALNRERFICITVGKNVKYEDGETIILNGYNGIYNAMVVEQYSDDNVQHLTLETVYEYIPTFSYS